MGHRSPALLLMTEGGLLEERGPVVPERVPVKVEAEFADRAASGVRPLQRLRAFDELRVGVQGDLDVVVDDLPRRFESGTGQGEHERRGGEGKLFHGRGGF